MGKLYEVTIMKSFYYFGDRPPCIYEAKRCASDEGAEFDVESRVVMSDTLGAGLSSLVHGDRSVDMTVAEAIAKGGE